MTGEQKDRPAKDHRSAVENYGHVYSSTSSNWLLWLSAIYMPFALYLGFVAQPLVWLLGTWTDAEPEHLAIAQFVEIIAWIALPLIGAIVIYCKMSNGND